MTDHLGTLWIIFLLVWLILLIIKTRLNYIIYQRKNQDPNLFSSHRDGFTIFMINLFTIYNPHHKYEEPGYRKLKIRTNLLHLLFIYGFIGIVGFTFITFIANDISNHKYERNNYSRNRDHDEEVTGNSSRFDTEYNEVREEKNLIPLPYDFYLSPTSDEHTEIWKNQKTAGKKNFHEMKYIYIEDGEWTGEYDIFVMIPEHGLDQTLNVEFTEVDGVIESRYRHDDKEITEKEFKEMMILWDLEDQL